jgi:hypothetical protein
MISENTDMERNCNNKITEKIRSSSKRILPLFLRKNQIEEFCTEEARKVSFC